MNTRSSPMAHECLYLWNIRDITKSVRLNRVSDYEYQSAGFGGTADVFCGVYQRDDGCLLDIAVKCVRPNLSHEQGANKEIKTQRRLLRELEIWQSLSGCNNIVKLLGVLTGIGPLPSPVCVFCAWNLYEYLERKTPPPKHTEMLIDSLRGLTYMHGLGPNPIAHGDIKSHNILVTADERAMLCDFGRSRAQADLPQQQSNSSPFGATLRYMSPEVLLEATPGPTLASDMWAYGCVALEILCRIQPYSHISDDHRLIEQIRLGHPPSERPRGARAILLSDNLWSLISSCWVDQQRRPTSNMFLEDLDQLLQDGQLPTSPFSFDLFPTGLNEPLVPWPDEIKDLKDLLKIQEGVELNSSIRSNIWMALLESQRSDYLRKSVAIKVPRLNVGLHNREAHDHLQQILRKTLYPRYEVRHQNIVRILGIDSTFSPHPGLVFEYCANGNLTKFCSTFEHGWDYTGKMSRPKRPGANAFSVIWDVLEGLKYIHDYPIPIPQGDLNPDNILVSEDGTAKIHLFSLGRVIASIPAAAALTTSIGPLLALRWMSPELLQSGSNPSTESDMWSVGCVSFWLFTGLRPYAGHLRDEFASVDTVRGIPPANISQIDYAPELGDRRQQIAPLNSWITNGLWSTISRCWTFDPLLRPSAKGFLRVLKDLEGRLYDWLPLNVADLAGKITLVHPGENIRGPTSTRISRDITVWMHYRFGRSKSPDFNHVDMLLLRTTYKPNWYSKSVPVVIKHEYRYHPRTEPQVGRDPRPEYYGPLIRHEIAISAQLEHPNIIKLIGIDSTLPEFPMMVFENIPNTNLHKRLSPRLSFEDNLQIVKDITSALVYLHEHPNGMIAYGNINEQSIFVNDEARAKLTNFSRSFQYATQPTQIPAPLSAIVSGAQNRSIWHCPEYMQAHNPTEFLPNPTAPGDIWALGLMILRLFIRKHPHFSNKDRAIERILGGYLPCEAVECEELDPRLLSLVRSIFKANPKERPFAKNVLQVVSEL